MPRDAAPNGDVVPSGKAASPFCLAHPWYRLRIDPYML
jgi:hypothetical protein